MPCSLAGRLQRQAAVCYLHLQNWTFAKQVPARRLYLCSERGAVSVLEIPFIPASYHCTSATNSSCIRGCWHNRTIQGCSAKAIRLKALQNVGHESPQRVVKTFNEARSTEAYSFFSTILQLADATVNSRLEVQNSSAVQIGLLKSLLINHGQPFILTRFCASGNKITVVSGAQRGHDQMYGATKLLLCQGPKGGTTTLRWDKMTVVSGAQRGNDQMYGATKLLLCQGPKGGTTRCTVRQNKIQKQYKSKATDILNDWMSILQRMYC